MNPLHEEMDDFEKRLAARLAPPPVDVPDDVDRAVLASAGRALRWRRWRPRLARLAASLLLAIVLFLVVRGPDGPQADVDGDGAVDIVDAYVLGLKLRDGAGLDRRWDLNDDGAVDMADLQAIARKAVALGEET